MFEGLLARLGKALDSAAIPYMLIGGQAVLLHGQPRATEDIDITLGLDNSQLPRLLELAQVLGLEQLIENVGKFVIETNVLPMRDPGSGIRIDWIFSFTPYEQQAIAHAVRCNVGGQELRFASVDDLILHKLFAGRPRDIEDIRGILLRRGAQVDGSYLHRWVEEFSTLEGKAHLVGQLENLLMEFRK